MPQVRSSRRVLLGATALAGALSMLSTTASRAQSATIQFDQPAQPLASALRAYSATADQEIMFADALVSGRNAPELKGPYTADGALMALLDGAGLTVRRTTSGVLLVERIDADPQSGSAAGAGAEVEALIVTAQKREEDIQDVPIAISAFSQEDLTRSQIAGGPDLITQVPNMTFTKTNFSSYSVQIRGIGTQAISATTDPAVAVAFNNTPFIRNRFFEQEFYDLQRVEVLRGPQGTLYGRNATAGVVNIISAKPKFTTEAKLSADVSNYNSSRVEGMINIPLVEDVAALRLAGAWTKREGYATNEISGNPIDGRDLWSTRLSLRFAPTDAIDVNLIWEHFEEDDDRLRSGKQLCHKDVVTDVGGIPVGYYDTLPKNGQHSLFAGVQAIFSQGCKRGSLYSPDAFQTPNGLMLPYYLPLGSLALPVALTDPYVSTIQSPDLRVIESTVDPDYRAKTDVAELQISWDLAEGLTLTSETAYSADAISSLQDFNRFNTQHGAWRQPTEFDREGVLQEGPYGGIFCDPQLGCSDRLVAVDLSTAKSRHFSQEFRLGSELDGPFNFSLGANYLRYDTEDKYYVFINSLSLVAASGTLIAGNQGTPYVGGSTTNEDCLIYGPTQGDPAGVYSVSECIYLEAGPINSLSDKGHNYFLSKNPYKLISYAVFGEAYYNLADNLKVTAGLRWSVDRKEAPRVPSWTLGSLSVGYPVAETIEQEWREPTGRITVDWKPRLSFTDETLLYASYAHGYKAGGANPPTFVKVYYNKADLGKVFARNSETKPKTFEPEFINAFEIGTKNAVFDGILTINAAAFYYDYTDYQISEIVDRQAFNRNFDAKIWGAEIEADWRPLENLKLGLKAGYEKTRIADGEAVIDLMERNYGHGPNSDDPWIVVRPFPTQASNCVLPLFLYLDEGPSVRGVGSPAGGGPGGCELAYLKGVDPQTELAYVPNPTEYLGPEPSPDYPGWDPLADYGNNQGEGFLKPIGGNELPNAPNWTLTGTVDYTIPLPNDWLATLHTDLHWQSESWWRLFQDSEFSRLDEYFTMNLAAIFTNEERGWNVMAYIKNVTDETAITGAFLNSDDTGLTTNVFLTEPRLYGIRVTKTWEGGPVLGSFVQRRSGPYPITVELGNQVQWVDTPYETMAPGFAGVFPASLYPLDAQHQKLDTGDGREIRLTYRPRSGSWWVSASARFGKTNGQAYFSDREEGGPAACRLPYNTPSGQGRCNPDYVVPGYPPGNFYDSAFVKTPINWSARSAAERDEHQIVDFAVGKDIGMGLALIDRSSVSFGVRSARFETHQSSDIQGVPDMVIPDFWQVSLSHFNRYKANVVAQREFDGTGPVVTWDGTVTLLGADETGRIDLDWSLSGGVLFGKQDTSVSGGEQAGYYRARYQQLNQAAPIGGLQETAISSDRSQNVQVPLASAGLGLSYSLDWVKIGAGYRWERYFDVIDGGFEEHQSFDRTIDGPYFKLSVGFGGG